MVPHPGFSGNFEHLARQRAEECRRILLVFGLAWIVRLMHVLSLKVSPIFTYKIGDAARYDAWARSLADGNWLGDGVFYQAPLYPYFLGVVYSTLGDSILTVRLVQSLIGALSCVLLMLAATNLFGRTSGLISGICLALYAPSIFLEGLIQKSTLDLFFLTCLLWLISKAAFRPRVGQWLWMGIATGALCLTRENALVLVPIFGAWLALGSFAAVHSARSMDARPAWRTSREWKRRLSWAAAFACGLALTLGPVAIRNYVVGGQFHLTTSQLGPNFYIGNNPDANGTYRPLRPGRGDAQYEQRDAVELAEQAVGRSLTPREVSQYYLAESLEFIRRQPVEWLKLLALKTGLTFNRLEIIDTEDQYTVARISPTLWLTETVFNFGFLVPLAVVGLIATRSRWRRLWVVYLMLAAFALTVIAFFVFGRYRFPLAPPLMLFVGPAWLVLRKQWITCRWKQLGGTLLLLGSMSVVTHLDLFSPRVGRGITLSNYGVQAMIRSDFSQAESFLVSAVKELPASALVHNNLGVLYRETDRLELAQKHFRKALLLEPEDDKIRRNLERLVTASASQRSSSG